MDVFKLAFETTIVGLLAFLWLAVATYLLFPGSPKSLGRLVTPDIARTYQAAIGVGVLTAAYCLGSAILPIANQLVNDEHWPLTENAIRCQVFTSEAQQLEFVQDQAFPLGKDYSHENWKPLHCSYWGPVFNPRGKETGRAGQQKIHEKIFWGFLRLLRLWVGLPSYSHQQQGGPNEKALVLILEDLELGKDGEDRLATCGTPKPGLLKEVLDTVCADLGAQEHKQALDTICGEQGPGKSDDSIAEKCDELKVRKILTLFQHEEVAVMSQTSSDTEQLKLLHERIVVLRGAVFSGFVLLLICVFACFAPVLARPTPWIRPASGVVLALIFATFALLNGARDLVRQNIFDIPVLESLLLAIIIFGMAVVFRGIETPLFRTRRCVLVALFFTGLAYGGWMWSEILYDQQIMNSFAVIQEKPIAPKQ